MSILEMTQGQDTDLSQNAKDFANFFDESPKNLGETLKRLPIKYYRVKSWVRDQDFRLPGDEEESVHSEYMGSSLSESVFSCIGFRERRKRLREKSPEIIVEEEDNSPFPEMHFFEEREKANLEVKMKNPKWKHVDGFYIEHFPETEEEAISKFREIMLLLDKNHRSFYQSIFLKQKYSFDWEEFSKYSMQFVVFTKTCTNHPDNYLVEMRKEEEICQDCKKSEFLKIQFRLSVPLDLSEIPIPCNQDVKVFVAFSPEDVLEKSEFDYKGRSDFSLETAEKMYGRYENMRNRKMENEEYTMWFERCRQFLKDSLSSKKVQIHGGQVLRRKFEESGNLTKFRCSISAQFFQLF